MTVSRKVVAAFSVSWADQAYEVYSKDDSTLIGGVSPKSRDASEFGSSPLTQEPVYSEITGLKPHQFGFTLSNPAQKSLGGPIVDGNSQAAFGHKQDEFLRPVFPPTDSSFPSVNQPNLEGSDVPAVIWRENSEIVQTPDLSNDNAGSTGVEINRDERPLIDIRADPVHKTFAFDLPQTVEIRPPSSERTIQQMEPTELLQHNYNEHQVSASIPSGPQETYVPNRWESQKIVAKPINVYREDSVKQRSSSFNPNGNHRNINGESRHRLDVDGRNAFGRHGTVQQHPDKTETFTFDLPQSVKMHIPSSEVTLHEVESTNLNEQELPQRNYYLRKFSSSIPEEPKQTYVPNVWDSQKVVAEHMKAYSEDSIRQRFFASNPNGYPRNINVEPRQRLEVKGRNTFNRHQPAENNPVEMKTFTFDLPQTVKMHTPSSDLTLHQVESTDMKKNDLAQRNYYLRQFSPSISEEPQITYTPNVWDTQKVIPTPINHFSEDSIRQQSSSSNQIGQNDESHQRLAANGINTNARHQHADRTPVTIINPRKQLNQGRKIFRLTTRHPEVTTQRVEDSNNFNYPTPPPFDEKTHQVTPQPSLEQINEAEEIKFIAQVNDNTAASISAAKQQQFAQQEPQSLIPVPLEENVNVLVNPLGDVSKVTQTTETIEGQRLPTAGLRPREQIRSQEVHRRFGEFPAEPTALPVQRFQQPQGAAPQIQRKLSDEDLIARQQAERARYAFSSKVSDTINDNSQTRQEVRDGLRLRGLYSYSDGFFNRTVHYEADENGYRVVKEESQPIGSGPMFDPQGQVNINYQHDGSNLQYAVTGEELRRIRNLKAHEQRKSAGTPSSGFIDQLQQLPVA